MKKNSKRTAVCTVVFMGILLAALTSCQNNAGPLDNAGAPDNGSGLPNASGPLLSFGFEKRFNDFLSADIIGTVDQSTKTITVTVPEAAYKKNDGQKGNRKFKASFKLSSNAKLFNGTKEQKSGELEDWFIKDREYRVKTENGSSTMYKLCIKIAYATPPIDPADAETLKQFYGSYFGKLDFDHNLYDICVVYDKDKLISYSQAMSARYTNMQWEKKSETEWVCTAYSKKDFKRKEVKSTVHFKIGSDNKITCKLIVNAMGNAPSNDMPKGADYVWAADDGKGFKEPNES